MICDPDGLLALVAHFAEREGVPLPVSRSTSGLPPLKRA
jgi:hypothetical protein